MKARQQKRFNRAMRRARKASFRRRNLVEQMQSKRLINRVAKMFRRRGATAKVAKLVAPLAIRKQIEEQAHKPSLVRRLTRQA